MDTDVPARAGRRSILSGEITTSRVPMPAVPWLTVVDPGTTVTLSPRVRSAAAGVWLSVHPFLGACPVSFVWMSLSPGPQGKASATEVLGFDPLDDLPTWASQFDSKSLVETLRVAVDLDPSEERFCLAMDGLLGLALVDEARALLDYWTRSRAGTARVESYRRVLAPPEFHDTPASDLSERDRRDDAWIENNCERYRGQWVILLDGDFIGAGPDLQEVWRLNADRLRGADPLVHRIQPA